MVPPDIIRLRVVRLQSGLLFAVERRAVVDTGMLLRPAEDGKQGRRDIGGLLASSLSLALSSETLNTRLW